MEEYLIIPNKKCSNCNNKDSLFIKRDGYLICSKCGYVILSYNPFNDFMPIGFYEKPKSLEEMIKKIKKDRPDIKEDDLLYRLELFSNKPEKEIRRAIKLYEKKKIKRLK